MQKIICFDVGGTKIAMAVIEINEKEYKFLDSDTVSNPTGTGEIKEILLNYCKKNGNKFGAKKVAAALAKIVNQEKKKILQAEEVYGAEKFDFKFLEETGYEIKIENDGRCFALGEYYFGQGQGARSLLTVTYGTDMGGGFLIKGKGYQGAHYSSLEISHTKFFDRDQIKAWRDLAGGRTIQDQYNQKTGNSKTTEEIFILAENGDENAAEIIKNAGKMFGIGLSNLVTILDPEMIIIGGSVAVQKKYINNIFEIAKENTFNKNAEYIWKISELKEKANLLGAGSLYL